MSASFRVLRTSTSRGGAFCNLLVLLLLVVHLIIHSCDSLETFLSSSSNDDFDSPPSTSSKFDDFNSNNNNNNNNLDSMQNNNNNNNNKYTELSFDAYDRPPSKSGCCQDVMIIDSSTHPEGYLKAPPLYDEMNEPKNANKLIECVYKFYGKDGERIQLFYEDFDLYYPYDIYKFNKIDCRYSDSICLKFYENPDQLPTDKTVLGANTAKFLKIPSFMGGASSLPSSGPTGGAASQPHHHHHHNHNTHPASLENQNYDLCNCINVSYTPRQIMSASNFIQVRFRTIRRSFDSHENSAHSRKPFRGYLIRYKFTRDYGLDTKESGDLDRSGQCKLSFYSASRRSGYFSSPNYPGLYPRDTECHYYFLGQENERVQITFHTFDVEGVDQCRTETKSDFVELSNFQNRDRYYSRFCGLNKPGTVLSDDRFFHVTFHSNNVFDAKGFQASYYFIKDSKSSGKKLSNSVPVTGEKNSASLAVSGRAAQNSAAASSAYQSMAFIKTSGHHYHGDYLFHIVTSNLFSLLSSSMCMLFLMIFFT